jgi:hypothetical protein
MKKLRPSITAIAVFISRLGVFPPNISAVGSFGFFSQNLPLYVAITIGFDLLIGGLYKGFWFTYLGFFAYYLFGRFAKTLPKQIVLLPLASFTFFLLSNLGVWWYWYPHTIDGLLRCYLLAVPFYRNTLIGEVLFGYGYLAVKHINNSTMFTSIRPLFKS